MTVFVFRTSVRTQRSVERIRQNLDQCPGVLRWTFDLQDCDHVLRVEAVSDTSSEKLRNCLTSNGFTCEELE